MPPLVPVVVLSRILCCFWVAANYLLLWPVSSSVKWGNDGIHTMTCRVPIKHELLSVCYHTEEAIQPNGPWLNMDSSPGFVTKELCNCGWITKFSPLKRVIIVSSFWVVVGISEIVNINYYGSGITQKWKKLQLFQPIKVFTFLNASSSYEVSMRGSDFISCSKYLNGEEKNALQVK